MTKDIVSFLLTYFPASGKLPYEDFIHEDEKGTDLLSHVFECNEKAQRYAFELISRPWPEIDWFEISTIGGPGSDIWFLPVFLNEKSFIYSFPSLLNFLSIVTSQDVETSVASGLMAECFENQLVEYKQNWKREFYLSLHREIKKLVSGILTKSHLVNTNDAIGNLWHE
jgi:hypothetical protein